MLYTRHKMCGFYNNFGPDIKGKVAIFFPLRFLPLCLNWWGVKLTQVILGKVEVFTTLFIFFESKEFFLPFKGLNLNC